MEYLLPLIVMLAAALRFILWWSNRPASGSSESAQADAPERNYYFEARSNALGCLPGHLGLNDVRENEVYAIVVESHIGDKREMLLANLLGEAELYEFPHLVGETGLRMQLKESAIALVQAASDCLALTERSREVSPPQPAHVKFFLITLRGAWVAQYAAIGPSHLREEFQHLYSLATALKVGLKGGRPAPAGPHAATEVKEKAPARKVEQTEEPQASLKESLGFPHLYLLQNGNERIITRLDREAADWESNLSFFLGVKAFHPVKDSIQKVGLYCADLDSLALQLQAFQRQEAYEYCLLDPDRQATCQLQLARLRRDATDRAHRLCQSEWVFVLDEYKDAYYLAVEMPQGYSREILLSAAQADAYKLHGRSVVDGFVQDMLQQNSPLYDAAETEGRAKKSIYQVVPKIAEAVEPLAHKILPTSSFPLTKVVSGGNIIIAKAVLSPEDWAAKLDRVYGCVTYPDLQAMFLTGDYYGEAADLQHQISDPHFQLFHASIDPYDMYRLQASSFPITEVDGKVLTWNDWDFLHLERQGRQFLLVYTMILDTQPCEIILSTEQVRLIEKFQYSYLQQLALEMRAPNSAEMERAYLEGRLVKGPFREKATGLTELALGNMKFEAEKLLFSNPDSHDERYWLQSYRDLRSVDFECNHCGNQMPLTWNSNSPHAAPNYRNIDPVRLEMLGSHGNLHTLLRCNQCFAYFLVGLVGFEPHNGQTVVALASITALRRPPLRPVQQLHGLVNYGEMDVEEVVQIMLHTWGKGPTSSGRQVPEKEAIVLRFTTPWKDGKRRLNKIENEALEYLHYNEEAIHKAILAAVYEHIKSDFGEDLGRFREARNPQALDQWVGLKQLVLLAKAGRDANHLGFEIVLEWNPSLPATVEMYKDSVIHIGFGKEARIWPKA